MSEAERINRWNIEKWNYSKAIVEKAIRTGKGTTSEDEPKSQTKT